MEELYPQAGITQYTIKLNESADEQEVIKKLSKRFSLEAYSWQDLYPALISALTLETYGMFLILALILSLRA